MRMYYMFERSEAEIHTNVCQDTNLKLRPLLMFDVSDAKTG